MQTELSVVVPVLDEEESLPALRDALVGALDRVGRSWEVIFVDDGSRDATPELLARFAAEDPRVKVVRFRRNFGQTAAMAAGFDHASGAVVVPMDGDLQNDPEDIGRMLARLDEGCDLVAGWRRERKDAYLTKTLPSRLGNRLISHVTGVHLHDYGCTLKAIRSQILQEVHLYGEMHRFLPVFAHLAGARIAELPVTHHARRFGRSKYTLSKAFRVLLDLMTVRFLAAYATKPLYFFGRLALWLFTAAFLALGWVAWRKLGQDVFVKDQPLFLVAIFSAIAGLQMLLIGLLAEMTMRTYYESQRKPTYVIRETHNLERSA